MLRRGALQGLNLAEGLLRPTVNSVTAQFGNFGLSPAANDTGDIAPFGSRNVSLQAVKARMKSVGSTKKITAATKLIAATKLKGAERRALASRGLAEPIFKLMGDLPALDVKHTLTVPITTDKGLCGGVNTILCKYARTMLQVAEEGEEKKATLAVIGEKGRSQLRRTHGSYIDFNAVDIGKVGGCTFNVSSALAEECLKTGYDKSMILYNKFQSAIKFVPTFATVPSPATAEVIAEEGGKFDEYEIDEEGTERGELLMDLMEFQMAAMLHNAILENATSEQASKMQAMENATKNAGEMLNKLTLLYNRSRQAAITTELIEIISGASALEG